MFLLNYGGQPRNTLAELRYTKYQAMITVGSKTDPSRLPPTERAAHFASLRVYLQVMRWETLDEAVINRDCLCDWGWKFGQYGLMPIYTDKEPAPDEILHIIRCKCKTRCATSLCGCKKHGLRCVEACTGCRGNGCLNSENIELQDENAD